MLALPLAPSITVLLLTAGSLLIVLELNRPGTVLFGCLGLLAVLIGIASILRTPHPWPALGAFAAAAAFALIATRRPSRILGACITLSLCMCFSSVNASAAWPERVFALSSALVLGVLTHWLASIAHIARANKTGTATSNFTSSARNPLD